MNTVQMVPIGLIDPHPKNRRHELADLPSLAKSIKAQGVRQNLLLVPQMINEIQEQDGRRHGPTHRFESVDNERYTVVIGHRRLAAAELAGLTEVPAVVDPTLTEADQLELMLVENLQREGLTPIEEAEGYQELLDLGLSVATIAKKVGRSAKVVKDRAKLLTLPEAARERIQSGQGSLLDAAKLDEFADDPDTLDKLAGLIGTANFSVEWVRAKETRKRHAEQQPIVDALLAKGLTEITDRATSRGRSWIMDIRQADKVEGLTLPEGSVFFRGTYYSDVEVWGPESAADDESDDGAEAAAAAKAERDAAWAAERAQREAEAAEAEECWQTRDAWIRERITGRFTHQQRAMLAEHVAPVLLTQGGLSSYSIGTWLGIDFSKTEKARQKAIAEFMEGRDWAAYLLVFLHLLAGHSWSGRALPVLYEVLEQLGYQVSDAERSRVTEEGA